MRHNWKHHYSENIPDTGNDPRPILHDQFALEAYTEGNQLYFSLPEGFWIHSKDPTNPYGAAKRAAPGLVCFHLTEEPEDAVYLRLFTRHRFCRGIGFTTVSVPDLKTLMENLHSGKWRLEFISRHTSSRGVFLQCSIRSGKKYHDFQMEIDCGRISCFWDDLQPESEW